MFKRAVCLFAFSATWGLSAAGVAGSSTPTWLTLAVKELPKLQVKSAAPMTGYSRAMFGPAWQDVDHNSCDTRDDILRRDLKPVVFQTGGNCVVSKGTLHDLYTGKIIHFLRGVSTSMTVQIDHVVALGDAWRTGARTWNADRRLAYANDPVVLLAVDGPANNQKSDGDSSVWLPPKKSFDCRYVAKQIAIKTKYGLWLTPAEHIEMAALLPRC